MKKLNHNDVRNYIESFPGYKLVSKEYKNSLTKIEILCPCGNIFEMSYGSFQAGHRCPVHKNERIAKGRRTPFHKIQKYVIELGFDLLSGPEDFKNSKSYLTVKCKEGHIRKVMWISFKKNKGCQICSGINKRNSISYVKNYIKSVKGYQLISEKYEHAQKKIFIKCDKGHVFSMQFNCFQQGQRCSVCNRMKTYSNGEKEVLKYIQSIYNGTIVPNDRSQIVNPKSGRNIELDIWLPEINKAVEYNGNHWHSNNYSIYKDFVKRTYCSEKNIDLLVINDLEWKKYKDFESIRNFINDNGI